MGFLARRRAPAARNLTVFPTDVFLVSYPRSGNTWLRFLVANALHPEADISFASVGRFVPDIYDEPDRALQRVPQPRILKSHEPYDPRYRRVVYLVRRPADVAVSYYHYLIKTRAIGEGYDLARFVGKFLDGRLDAGRWRDHVSGWLDARAGGEEFLLLRYEDVLEDPAGALRAVLQLVGAQVGDTTVELAVRRSAADEMRRLERETAAAHPPLRRTRLDKPFIRTATAGAGRAELGPPLASKVDDAWPDVMRRLGYRSATERAADAREEPPGVPS